MPIQSLFLGIVLLFIIVAMDTIVSMKVEVEAAVVLFLDIALLAEAVDGRLRTVDAGYDDLVMTLEVDTANNVVILL